MLLLRRKHGTYEHTDLCKKMILILTLFYTCKRQKRLILQVTEHKQVAPGAKAGDVHHLAPQERRGQRAGEDPPDGVETRVPTGRKQERGLGPLTRRRCRLCLPCLRDPRCCARRGHHCFKMCLPCQLIGRFSYDRPKF